MTTTFQPIKLGGGGFVVDIDISNDGLTKLARPDVHGMYCMNASGIWEQAATSLSMPSADRQLGNNDACCYAARVAPSDSNRVYMVYPGTGGFLSTVYRSDNRCATWTKLTGFTAVNMTVQSDPGRLFGPKMAVDPKNPDHVIVGSSAGLFYRTTNGGTTWAQITATSVPVTGITEPSVAFDPSAALTGGLTSVIYIAWGTGTNRVWRSTDGGATFTQLAGGPNTVRRCVVGPEGNLYLTENNAAANNLWRLVGTTWTNISPTSVARNWHSVAADPTTSGKITAGFGAGNITTSMDFGANWGGFYDNAAIRVATDVPWLAWTKEDWMGNGNQVYDPIVSGKLWFAEGIGIWHTTPLLDATQPTWTSQTRGNDELICTSCVVPPGSAPLFGFQDRGVFRIGDLNAYPNRHSHNDQPIRHGWAVDYAKSSPNFIVAIFNSDIASDLTGYSPDGGMTWTDFATQPMSYGFGGAIAASTPTNFVWAPSQDKVPSYTTNGGTTWTTGTFPGAATTPPTGWGFSQYQMRNIVCADEVTANKFYAYNYLSGFYRTTNGGVTWTRANGGAGALIRGGEAGTCAKLTAVPGRAGHLFFAIGLTAANEPHPYNVGLYRSTDGADSWTELTNTNEVWSVGFGAAAPGGSYPAIYIAGYANGDSTAGIYVSIDNAVTWTKLTSNPYNSTDHITCISGDMNRYGAVYFGNSGSGAGYGNLDGVSPPSPPDPVPPPPPPPPPPPVPATYKWQAYKSGSSTIYRILEGTTDRCNNLSRTECRWLCGVLKIPPP